MSAGEVRRVLDAAAGFDPAAALALRIAAVAGARRAELAALRWSDLAGDRLTIDSAIETERHGRSGDPMAPTLTDAPTKTANRRVVVVDRELAALRRQRADLLAGLGRYAGTSEGAAARQLLHARRQHREAEYYAETSTGWRDRRHWRKEATHWADEECAAEAAFTRTVVPEASRLDEASRHLDAQRDELDRVGRERDAWLAEHPEANRRLQALDRELSPLPELPEIILDLGRTQAAGLHRDVGVEPPGHGIELDFGP